MFKTLSFYLDGSTRFWSSIGFFFHRKDVLRIFTAVDGPPTVPVCGALVDADQRRVAVLENWINVCGENRRSSTRKNLKKRNSGKLKNGPTVPAYEASRPRRNWNAERVDQVTTSSASDESTTTGRGKSPAQRLSKSRPFSPDTVSESPAHWPPAGTAPASTTSKFHRNFVSQPFPRKIQ